MATFDDLERQISIIPADLMQRITPDLAREMMGFNERNRTLSRRKVDEYADAMRRGEWAPANGATIAFSPDGRLLDGQHRLAASIEADYTFTTFVVEVPDAAQTTMDRGTKRSFKDFLTMRGLKNAGELAAATKIVWAFSKTKVPAVKSLTTTPTIEQLVEFLADNPQLPAYVNTSSSSTLPGAPRSFVAAMTYIFATHTSPDDAEMFFMKLHSGEDLAAGDPILTLRKKLLDQTPARKIDPKTIAAFTVKAYNAFRRSDTLQLLRWNPGGAHPDVFPEIELDA